jgi:hypothetical protein
LGAVPKTAAALANLQLNAQFHDFFSVVLPHPAGFLCFWWFRGVNETTKGDSGFFRPDGGLPSVFLLFLS